MTLNDAIPTPDGNDVYYGRTGSTRLLDGDGRPTRVSLDRMGFFRLPSSGWFVLQYPGAYRPDQLVQLTLQRRVTHRAGEVLDVPRRVGYQYVVRVRAPYHGARLVSFGQRTFGYVAADGFWQTFTAWDEPMFLAPGYPVVSGGRPTPLRTAPEPGSHVSVLLDPSDPARVESRRVPVTALTVDGELIDVPADYRSTVAATFFGRAGQYVHLQRHGPDTAADRPIVLFGPGHRAVDWNRFDDVYRLPYTGTYTALATSVTEVDRAYAFRPASLQDVGEVRVDGAPLVVEAQPDPRLVMGHLVGVSDSHLTYAQVTGDTLSGADWQVFAGILERCGPHDGNGCGDYGWVYLTRELPGVHGPFYGDLVLVDSAASTSGSVAVSFTSTSPTAESRLPSSALDVAP